MTDDYTPARMRELADNAFDTEFRVLQAALRAAADRIVSLESQSNATQIAYQTAAQHLADALNEAEHLSTTLAAREALLKRAEKFATRIEVLEPAADEPVRLVGRHSIGFTIVPIGGRDMIAPEVWRAIDADARALAAEIAAALGGKTQGGEDA